jgi:dihydroneopterin aldolase
MANTPILMTGFVTQFFTGLTLQVSIGIHEREKAAPQRLLIDLDYDVTVPAGAGDDLDGRLNYDHIREEVETIASSRHFNLQETLCAEILASLLAHGQITRARVSVRKPDAYRNVDAVGVMVEGRKQAAERRN